MGFRVTGDCGEGKGKTVGIRVMEICGEGEGNKSGD